MGKLINACKALQVLQIKKCYKNANYDGDYEMLVISAQLAGAFIFIHAGSTKICLHMAEFWKKYLKLSGIVFTTEGSEDAAQKGSIAVDCHRIAR